MRAIFNVMLRGRAGFKPCRDVDLAAEIIEDAFGVELQRVVPHTGTTAPDDYLVDFDHAAWAAVQEFYDPTARLVYVTTEAGHVSVSATVTEEETDV